MRNVARAGALSLSALAGLAVVVAASGWLYLIVPRLHYPGPVVADALPLDELPGQAGAPLLVFVAIWVPAAALLGLIARVVQADRFTATLLLALGVGIWSYLESAISFVVVRQISAEVAFRATAEVNAVYLPAALAGLAGALLGGERRPKRPRAPALLAWFVAAAGLLAVLDALLPEYGRTLLADLAPGARPLARSLEGPLGVVLLVVAPALARRRARAWQLTLVLLAGLTVLHVLHSDYGAAPTGLLALALLSQRRAFDAPGDPDVKPRLLARFGLLIVALYAYGAAVLWANGLAGNGAFGAGFALRETTRAFLGLGFRASTQLPGDMARWFAVSVLVLGLAGTAWVIHGWLRPWRYRLGQGTRARELTRALVDTWGADTLAPFALRGDKSYFISDDERAFLAYRVVAGVAVVSGDPVGPTDAVHVLLSQFLAFARRRDWRVAVLGAGEDALHIYRSAGLRILYHGEEAVVQTSEFSLEGRAVRKVRQSVTRLERAGYRAEVRYAGDVDDDLRGDLQAIFDEWRGDSRVKGFTMEMDNLFRLDEHAALFVIGRDADGVAQGFLHFVVVRPGRALSLSSMPRRRKTPNGLNEWLVVTAIEWGREHGFERVSLNFAPFAALLSSAADLSAGERLERRALGVLKGRGFQLEKLLAFNGKFFPHWERRYFVYERTLDLPRVALASLAAEGYLPLRWART
jgi:lysyl-tRNA synthetase class 2